MLIFLCILLAFSLFALSSIKGASTSAVIIYAVLWSLITLGLIAAVVTVWLDGRNWPL